MPVKGYVRTMLTIAVVLTTVLFGDFAAAQNPLTGGSAPVERVATSPPPSGTIVTIAREAARLQRAMVDTMTRNLKAVRDGESYVALLLGLAVAFLYGVVHTLGPGHGKFVIATYFIGREATLGHGFLMAGQIALTHVVMAVVLVWLGDVAIRLAFGDATADRWIRVASYATLVAVGLYLLIAGVRGVLARRAAPALHHGHRHGVSGDGKGPQGLLSVAVGLAPCTGAILVMLFALANGMLLVGLVMVAAIGAGMAVTMAAIGLVAIYARARMMARLSGDETRAGVWGAAFQVAGAFVITALSAALLIDAL